ncbi:NAD(P)-binding protein [Setomelanomma holmii]|uniref:NAD(P)-binding protein n=1 Tax=Setomelanomma holmii TaxID=210430 RepID=A0A9P4H7B1_9PLEO|nr:NAD(P)-binding protein [Setomelanomma holmii]
MASALGLSSNTFNPDKDIPDLSGKVYVVTGGSAGIGYGIVAHILQHNPAKIYLLSNKEEHANEAKDALKEFGDVSKVEWRQCNLQDLKQTDDVAKALARGLTRLDALICNAGIGVGVYNETKDGIDSHMQVNIFAQAHLTMMLLPVLQNTKDSRIVYQSSDLHRGASNDTNFASLEEINQDLGPTRLYNRTKLAQIVFLRELYLRIKSDQFGPISSTGLPWINATHPGAVSTDQPKQAEEAYGKLGSVGVAFTRPFMKDPVSSGCRSALFAATSPDIVKDQVQNSYIVPDRKVTEVSNQAQNTVLGLNLWKLTKEVLETRLGELPYKMQTDDIISRGPVPGETTIGLTI